MNNYRRRRWAVNEKEVYNAYAIIYYSWYVV